MYSEILFLGLSVSTYIDIVDRNMLKENCLPTGEQLLRPVKYYIGEYLQTMLIGVGPKYLGLALGQFARESEESSVKRYHNQC